MAQSGENMIVVVDDSPAAQLALGYVTRLIGRRRGFRIVLMHVFPPRPTDLLKTGPLAQVQATERLDWALKILRKGGISPRGIDFAFSSPKDASDVVNAILKVARTQQCHTIVVAHYAHSWFREILGDHLAEELLRKAKGFALWVVE
jgi:nucleotide-binding universal stress UspA family protein